MKIEGNTHSIPEVPFLRSELDSQFQRAQIMVGIVGVLQVKGHIQGPKGEVKKHWSHRMYTYWPLFSKAL